MAKDLSSIAKAVIVDLKEEKCDNITKFGHPLFFAIYPDNRIEASTFAYILGECDKAIVILPFTYLVFTSYDESGYVIFIDERGIPTNKLTSNGWTLSFDEPKTSALRTYKREATISNAKWELVLPVRPTIHEADMEKVWSIFIQVQSISSLEGLKQLCTRYEEMGGCPYSYSAYCREIK